MAKQDLESKLVVTFELAGLYYRQAQSSIKSIDSLDASFRSNQITVEELEASLKAAELRCRETGEDKYEATESLCIQMDNAFSSYSTSAESLVSSAVNLHVFSALCLEAHINALAKDFFTGGEFDEFDVLSPVGKVLFYSRIRHDECLKAGMEPIQGLSRLVKRRNALVHYKRRRSFHPLGFQTEDL